MMVAVWLLGPLTARGAEAPGRLKPIERLEVFPGQVRLFGPEATQHLVVLGMAADGSTRDLTAEARLTTSTPGRVSIAPDRTIRPLADGTLDLVVRAGSASAHPG